MCFVATVDEHGIVQAARVVARGDVRAVLALPGVAQRGEMLLHNHPSGMLEPSDADLEVALRMHNGGIGFGIVDNAASEFYVVVEVPRNTEPGAIDASHVGEELGPAGPIAARLSRYENRPTQQAMSRAIAALYNEHGIGLFEAGTGVGKSLGYLLPALRWAAANGERTVVSTNTINLQEQLVGKDLPFLKGALADQQVRFALLKGWRNYLCLNRLHNTRDTARGLFESDKEADLETIRAWSEHTADGSLSDLATPPHPEVWDEVSAEPDLCLRLKCSFFEKCFLFQARKRAAQADVIIVNHHLLLADLAVRRKQGNWSDAAVLPAYKRLIVDEGHHFEDAAAQHLGASVTGRGLQRLFARLDRNGKGLLNAFADKLEERGKDDLWSAATLDLLRERLAPSAASARAKSGVLFDLLESVLAENKDQTLRLTDDFANHPVWRAGLDAALTDVTGDIRILQEGLRVVHERYENVGEERPGIARLLDEVRAIVRRLDSAASGLLAALRPPPSSEETVRWIEVRGRERNVAATAVPLDIAPILRDDLWNRIETGVITSATLAARADFRFLAERLGLDEPALEPVTAIFASPFDYQRQAILALPSDIAAPNVDAKRHADGVVRAILDLAGASDGGLFGLYTSHRDLQHAAQQLRSSGADRRWPLLVHGEDSRDALLRRFRESGRAILVGTASFWEGVDVPGDALRGLVLSKLPFRVPSEPLTAARCEAIERRGGDAFREFMLPHATLRLKQGFGRLIRTATDHGVVVLCDPRVLSKSYGREMLSALPPARRLSGPWPKLLPEIRAFYGKERA